MSDKTSSTMQDEVRNHRQDCECFGCCVSRRVASRGTQPSTSNEYANFGEDSSSTSNVRPSQASSLRSSRIPVAAPDHGAFDGEEHDGVQDGTLQTQIALLRTELSALMWNLADKLDSETTKHFTRCKQILSAMESSNIVPEMTIRDAGPKIPHLPSFNLQGPQLEKGGRNATTCVDLARNFASAEPTESQAKSCPSQDTCNKEGSDKLEKSCKGPRSQGSCAANEQSVLDILRQLHEGMARQGSELKRSQDSLRGTIMDSVRKTLVDHRGEQHQTDVKKQNKKRKQTRPDDEVSHDRCGLTLNIHGMEMLPTCTIVVEGLYHEVTDNEIVRRFAEFGTVYNLYINKKAKSTYIQFCEIDAAIRAIEATDPEDAYLEDWGRCFFQETVSQIEFHRFKDKFNAKASQLEKLEVNWKAMNTKLETFLEEYGADGTSAIDTLFERVEQLGEALNKLKPDKTGAV